MLKLNEKTTEKSLHIMLCLLVVSIYLTNAASGLETVIGISQTLVKNVCKVLILVSIVLCIPAYVSRMSRRIIVLLLGSFLMILAQQILFAENNEYFLTTVSDYVMQVVPAVLCMLCIRDQRTVTRKLTQCAYLISAIGAVILIFASNRAFSSKYSMGYAWSLLLPTNLLIADLWTPRRTKWARVLLLGCIAANVMGIVFYGSRGVLVAIAAFGLYSILKSKMSSRGKLIGIGIGVLLLPVMIFYREILGWVYEVITDMGMSSRTLYLLLNNAGYNSGRTDIWEQVIGEVVKSPFAIRGINADYLLVGQYSHNIAIELVYSFGIVLGGAATVYIALNCIRTLRLRWCPQTSLTILYFFSAFPLLLWSGSLWTNKEFWIWLFLIGKVSRRYLARR